MNRRAAVVGHLEVERRMDHLKGRLGDRINAVLAAAGACSRDGSQSFCVSSSGRSLNHAA